MKDVIIFNNAIREEKPIERGTLLKLERDSKEIQLWKVRLSSGEVTHRELNFGGFNFSTTGHAISFSDPGSEKIPEERVKINGILRRVGDFFLCHCTILSTGKDVNRLFNPKGFNQQILITYGL
jgi:hypothetical protein